MFTFEQAVNLGPYRAAVESALQTLAQARIPARIWEHDHTVWNPDPKDVTNRLGWLTIAALMRTHLIEIEDLVSTVRADGYTHALLMGMGGSSLGTDTLRRTFTTQPGYLDVNILDSTDPGAVAAYAQNLDLSRTLFIVATKSGGTAETLSFFKFFYNQLLASHNPDETGQHFIAITDPNSKLEALAKALKFRKAFLNDPNIGGRFSVLSYFGMVSAGLMGINIPQLLGRAQSMADMCGPDRAPAENPGMWLGATLNTLAAAGRDKLTFVASPAIESFGDWVEQLIAESTGKAGKGILPVVNAPIGTPDNYGEDRVFVHMQLKGDATHDDAVTALEQAGHPVIHLDLSDLYDVGAQFFLWEMATAVAGHLMGIQPFNQPNVEAAKIQARKFLHAYQQTGNLPKSEANMPDNKALHTFLDQAESGDYIAIHAYVTPTPETDAALQKLRIHLRNTTQLAVTTGYGPRFLHSTGQLHKGDAGNGLFIQMMAKAPSDIPIPDQAGETASAVSFEVLKQAQALGDYQALRDADRRVIRFDLDADVSNGINALWEK